MACEYLKMGAYEVALPIFHGDSRTALYMKIMQSVIQRPQPEATSK
jgi:hypothetical protein